VLSARRRADNPAIPSVGFAMESTHVWRDHYPQEHRQNRALSAASHLGRPLFQASPKADEGTRSLRAWGAKQGHVAKALKHRSLERNSVEVSFSTE
jgi:hypothetical protein